MAPAPSPEDFLLAEPDALADVQLDAYYMDGLDEDQRLPHRLEPNSPAPPQALRALGVLSWRLNPDTPEGAQKLAAIRRVRNYTYEDTIDVSPATLPGYDEKIKTFFEEHIHTDEEIRFVLEGSGYFDVRDLEDRWIRIHVKTGDMLVLPEGIYHRFTLDTSNHIKALRLFIGDPVWTPLNRPQETHPSREKYTSSFPIAV
ncbi:ARD1 [Auxenochlorella protothecoides x Auxenochlorella symbiontica]